MQVLNLYCHYKFTIYVFMLKCHLFVMGAQINMIGDYMFKTVLDFYPNLLCPPVLVEM